MTNKMTEKRYPEMIEHLPRAFQILIFLIVARLDGQFNCLIILVGKVGSGKSWASCSIIYWCFIYMNGREPTLEEMTSCWSFKSKELLQKMSNPNLKLKGLNLLDEAGTSMSSKTHQSIQNRIMSFLVQTFRNLQQLLILTVPMSSFVDKSVRNLMHYQIETRQILKKKKLCVVKPLELDYNVRIPKMFYHNLTYPSNDGSGFLDEVDICGIPAPPKFLQDAYEQKAGEFKAKLTKELLALLERTEEPEDERELYGEDLLLAKIKKKDGQQSKVLECFEKGIVKTGDIARELNRTYPDVSGYIRGMKDKGVNIEKIRRKNEVSDNISKKSYETT